MGLNKEDVSRESERERGGGERKGESGEERETGIAKEAENRPSSETDRQVDG